MHSLRGNKMSPYILKLKIQVFTAVKFFTVVLELVVNALKELHTCVRMCKCIFMCEYVLTREHGTVILVACCPFTTSVVWQHLPVFVQICTLYHLELQSIWKEHEKFSSHRTPCKLHTTSLHTNQTHSCCITIYMNKGHTWDSMCKLSQPAHEKERMWEGKMLPRCNMKKHTTYMETMQMHFILSTIPCKTTNTQTSINFNWAMSPTCRHGTLIRQYSDLICTLP